MNHAYFKRKYPSLSNVIACHFDEQEASDYDYQYLRRPELISIDVVNHDFFDAVKQEIRLLISSKEALAILEEDRWFVANFESEDDAKRFVLHEVWDVYFPNETFSE